MAPHMYPEFLDEESVLSPAEIDLYRAFSQQLGKAFFVFHSVAWLSIRHPGSRPSDGEVDFVIVHPRMGVILIEVKGGSVGYDSGHGWYSIRRDNLERISIKDPLEQVKRSKYALLDKIRSLPNWQGPIPTLGHAVAFPDGNTDLAELGTEIQRDMILLQSDKSDLDGWVRRCLEFWAGERFSPPGENGVRALRDLLARSWSLEEPRLGEEIGPETAAIDHFTDEQFRTLESLGRRSRAAIRGCAGSGKTVLAVRKARELARQGFQVLLTCYNRNLAEYLRKSCGSTPRLRVQHFHSLCRECAGRTEYDQRPEWNENRTDFFDEIMPNALLEVVEAENSEFQFDAIVVDEGQDFAPGWFDSLEYLLRDPDESLYYVFFDDNQLLYSRELELPVKELPFLLTRNCRNTQFIQEAVSRFYQSDKQVRVTGPDGRPVGITEWDGSSRELRTRLGEILARLRYAEGVDPADIVVLSPGGLESEPLLSISQPVPFHLVPDIGSGAHDVYTTTIRQFKGLEQPVVVLIVPPRGSWKYEELMYVGLSRARNHVEIIVSQEQTDALVETLQPEFLQTHPSAA